MAQTDLAVRFLSERHLGEIVPLLLPGHHVVVHDVMRTEVKIVERQSDEVVRAEIDGVLTILHVEFQSSHEADLGLRLLAYHALLAAREPLPVRSLLVYLMHEPPSSTTTGFSDAQVRFECDVFCPWTSPLGLAEVERHPALAPIAALTPGVGAQDSGGPSGFTPLGGSSPGLFRAAPKTSNGCAPWSREQRCRLASAATCWCSRTSWRVVGSPGICYNRS
jgi:hypothetical protein